MDALSEKQFKDYDYLSRYSIFPYYYNKLDDKYMQGLTGQLSEDCSFVLYEVKETDTIDSIALDMYANSTYFWVIADFNKIRDPFLKLDVGTILKIPTLADIRFKEI